MSRWAAMGVCACGLLAIGAVRAAAEEAKKVDLTPIVAASPAQAAAEAKFQKALDEKTSFDFVGLPLSQVVKFIKEKHKIDLQLDMKALEDASVGPGTTVTCTLDDITLRSALRLALGGVDLTYMVKDEVLLITTPDKANNELRTKVYPLSDLVEPVRGRFGFDNYQSVMDLISTTVAPTTWDEVGGPGSMREERKARALVISQTSEVHEQILELLTALRAARDSQPEAPKLTLLESIADSLWTMAHPRPGVGGVHGGRPGRGASNQDAGVGGGIGGMGGGMGGGMF